MKKLSFKTFEDDQKTDGRIGRLNIGQKKLMTPILFLGQIRNGTPNPWNRFKVDAVLFNAYEYYKSFNSNNGKEIDNTIHEIIRNNNVTLKEEPIVMMDSGGFLFQKKDVVDVEPCEILSIYDKMEPDIGVVLDHPLNPLKPKESKKRWQKTVENTKIMLEYDKIPIMPVIHGYSVDSIEKACQQIKKIYYDIRGEITPPIIGLGSLVPLIKKLKGVSKLHEDYTGEELFVELIKTVRLEFPNSFMHVFGVGGATTMHTLFSYGVDSIDSVAWRLKAAFGTIQLPGTGDRFLTPRKKRTSIWKDKKGKIIKEYEKNELIKCNCPVCKDKDLKKRISLLASGNHFNNRAIHNAFVYVNEVKLAREKIINKKYWNFVNNRLTRSPMKRLFHTKYGDMGKNKSEDLKKYF